MNLIRLSGLVLMSFVCGLAHAVTAEDIGFQGDARGYSLAESQEFMRAAGYRELLGGGDITSWWAENISRTMRTAVIPNRLPANSFARREAKWTDVLNEVAADTPMGRMTLRQAIDDPRSVLKAIVILRAGEIVFEEYPRLRPADGHFWASVAKPTAALVVEQLIDEGRLRDGDRVDQHLPDFAGTALGEVSVLQLLDMVPGTDTHDSPKTRQDPDSVATRYYLAEFGETNRAGQMETVREVLRSAGRTGSAGEVFEYSSGITQMLVLLAEAVTGQTWSDAFDERVWSHVRAEGPLQVHLAPDGMAAAHGIVSSRLRDLARYGLLYTDYWSLVADRQVVSDAAMSRIGTPAHGRDVFLKGDGLRFTEFLGELPLGNSRQWDAVYPDGGLFKGGLFGQGLYVSPKEGIVIAYYSTVPLSPLMRFLRPLAQRLKQD